MPMAITEELSLIDTVNEHYIVYLKTTPPHCLYGLVGNEGKKNLGFVVFFYIGLKAHLGEPALSVQKRNR